MGQVEWDVQVMRGGPCAARKVAVVEGARGQAGCLSDGKGDCRAGREGATAGRRQRESVMEQQQQRAAGATGRWSSSGLRSRAADCCWWKVWQRHPGLVVWGRRSGTDKQGETARVHAS